MWIIFFFSFFAEKGIKDLSWNIEALFRFEILFVGPFCFGGHPWHLTLKKSVPSAPPAYMGYGEELIYAALPLQAERLFPRIEPVTNRPQWGSLVWRLTLQLKNFLNLCKM